ncbi:MAG: DegT/DnrJ/EryC1/StrS family aminotransferase [Acidimicrobiales bacterium]
MPFLDLVRLHRSVHDELLRAFEAVVGAADFISGRSLVSFEEAFARAHHRGGAVGCGSGTDALALALRALGVGPGQDVVVPAMTFVATAEAVLHVGARPVLADVDGVSLLLTPETVEAASTPQTTAVVPVHLYGHAVPFSSLQTWRQKGLLVVEDAAQAHLASWRGRAVGEVGNVACFSFYPGKNLGSLGDGGMVVSDDLRLLDQVRRLGDHGRTSKYLHEVPGWGTRLDGLQAAFLDAKLAHLPEWTHARRRLADIYRLRLEGVDGVTLVPWEDGAVHHLLVARVADGHRDALLSALRKRGVHCGMHYPIALSDLPALSAWRRPCPEAERAAGEVLSLPMDPLMTEEEVDMVSDAVKAALDECRASRNGGRR